MAQRAGVTFELERLDLEGDQLVVTGHWSGVRGLRFVRPTLVSPDRRILATLEHKPWAPSLDRTWIAAFPWDRGDVDVGGLTLAVSPQVAVALDDGRVVGAPAAAPLRAAQKPLRTSEHELREPEPEPAEPERVTPPADRAARRLDAERLARLEDELDAVTRERDATQRDRDRALAQLDEAVAAREAAVRTRTRMELTHAEAVGARQAAEAALDAAHAQRDEANSQRDEVLLAYTGLQRHVKTERAHDDRAHDDRARAGEPDADADPEAPIGVRTMPAARTVMAELQRPKPIGKLPFSMFDLWVMRVLGTVAAVCFILLLLSIMRVFL